MDSKQVGHLGLPRNGAEGMFVGVPTTASTQATGTGNLALRVNIYPGFVWLGNKVKECDMQADFAVVTGNEMTSGQSKVYTVVLYLNTVENVIYQIVVKGTAATTGAQVPVTDAAIAAMFGPGTKWFRLCDITANRTGDTTVTQAQVNTVRPALVEISE